jgi:hypothetical protein
VQIRGRFCAYLDEGKIATVVEIVTVKASKNLKLQQISTTGTQQVPYQSVTNLNFQQISNNLWNLVRVWCANIPSDL